MIRVDRRIYSMSNCPDMKTRWCLIVGLFLVSLGTPVKAVAAGIDWHFEPVGAVPQKLVWQTSPGWNYELWRSADLSGWTRVEGYPKAGTGGLMEHPFTAEGRGFFKISAVTLIPDGFVLIPAGTFQMGDATNPPDNGGGELPVHPVQVSAFYMAKFEVTKAVWDEVRTWGLTHGYTDLAAGTAKGATHPVHSVSRRAVLKWCNARSEKEGLAPCYYSQGLVYRTGEKDPSWIAASGYRLPTEAEWEKVARGGLNAQRFPWGDLINHGQANYQAYSPDSFDDNPTSGYHPTFNDGVAPFTAPVGSFPANGYGVHDMAGNVSEWVWDWAGGIYPEALVTDPRGPGTGVHHVFRGGSWIHTGFYLRCSFRASRASWDPINYLGFRLARRAL